MRPGERHPRGLSGADLEPGQGRTRRRRLRGRRLSLSRSTIPQSPLSRPELPQRASRHGNTGAAAHVGCSGAPVGPQPGGAFTSRSGRSRAFHGPCHRSLGPVVPRPHAQSSADLAGSHRSGGDRDMMLACPKSPVGGRSSPGPPPAPTGQGASLHSALTPQGLAPETRDNRWNRPLACGQRGFERSGSRARGHREGRFSHGARPVARGPRRAPGPPGPP